MLNTKMICKNFDTIKNKLKSRNFSEVKFKKFVLLNAEYKKLLTETEKLKKYRNSISKTIHTLDTKSPIFLENIEKMKETSKKIKTLDAKINIVSKKVKEIAMTLPNLPHKSVPIGSGEEHNVEIRKWKKPRKFQFHPKPHWEIGKNLNIIDFKRGAKVACSRFVYYVNLGARLERALYNFMLNEHIYNNGYTEMITPYMVNSKSMFGTGQFPKFKEDVFQINENDLNLIPTAEIPLINYYSEEILEKKNLPIYLVSLSPSFRSEVGSAGRDTRGLIRLHQFNKVEMVKFTCPEDSYIELEKMIDNAEGILKKLKLPYRVIKLATGDMGFSSSKTYDLEVWMPAQNCYREISSCSNCEEFQARRAMIRYKEENGKIKYVHTLNGSGLAIGRTVAAILENYQNQDGTVSIPKELVHYMNGLNQIK